MFLSLSQRQIAFFGPLELVKESFQAQEQIFSHEKLCLRSGVGFLFCLLRSNLFHSQQKLKFGNLAKLLYYSDEIENS